MTDEETIQYAVEESVREGRITYRLINRKRHASLLQTTPYIPYLDLAIVFYVLVEADSDQVKVMRIQDAHLKMWGITKEQLFATACQMTHRLLPASFRNMREVIETYLPGAGRAEDPLYVLTNRMQLHGAAAILYPGQLQAIREQLGENFYVLPSSVHEVLVLPVSRALDKGTLRGIVRDINRTVVDPEDVLSDQVYDYRQEVGKLIL